MKQTSRSLFIVVIAAFMFWTLFLLTVSAQADPKQVILSMLQLDTNTPTNTPTETYTPPTETSTSTPTETYTPPTETPTDTPTETYTPPTETPTDTPTETYTPPTETPTDTPTATPTLDPTVNWIAPTGTLTSGYGNPIYQWEDIGFPSSYQLWVGRADGTQIIFENLSRSTYCGGGICSFDATTLNGAYWLPNGEYQAWLTKEQFGEYTEWAGPFTFTLDIPAPGTIASSSVAGEDTGNPTFSWTAASNAAWYEMWVVTGSPSWSVLYTGWHTYTQLGCNGVGICSITPDLNLPANAYFWYIRSWGPGGFSTGGENFGWTSGSPFDTSDVPAPDPVTTFNVIDVETGLPSITWGATANSTWYEVWVGTGSPDWTQVYNGWSKASQLGCNGGGTCSLLLELDVPGSYIWYVRSWGPGGFNTGGTTDSWVEAPAFVIP